MNIHERLLAALVVLIVCAVPAAGTTFVVNSAKDTHDHLPGDNICGDPNNPDSTCSLRAAIEESNALAGADTVRVPATLSPYRLSFGELLIDFDSLVLSSLNGRAIVDGANNTYLSHLIRITASHVTVSGLQLQRSHASALRIEGDSNLVGGTTPAERNVIVACGLDDSLSAGVSIDGPDAAYNRIVGNYIGVRNDGAEPYANPYGIRISFNAHHNHIGGNSAATRNIISGNRSYGIWLDQKADNNSVSGNFIGPDATGTTGPGNGGGILIADGATHSFIGGHLLGDRNIISANAGDGVTITGPATSHTTLVGNLVGLDVSGIIPIGNSRDGISIRDGASFVTVGDGSLGGSNFVTGNFANGIHISGSGCSNTSIKGNFIGVDTSGYRPFGNGGLSGSGVLLDAGTSYHTIGGAGQYDTNIIGGHPTAGITLNASHHNTIQGNLVGVSIYSLSSTSNGTGILLRNGSSDNLIGGAQTGEGNVLSGNRADEFPFGSGIAIYDPGSDRNKIIGNKIGTDDTGSRPIRNASAGVIIGNGAKYNDIGGPTSGERNIISGNGLDSPLPTLGRGIHVYGTGTSYNRIMGNHIGTGTDTTVGIPNLGNGIGIFDGAQYTVVGGDDPSDGNHIAANIYQGICIDGPASMFNSVRFNSIRLNGGLGIGHRNHAQMNITTPVIAAYTGSMVTGHSAPPGGIIDLYLAAPDSSGFGEGAAFLSTGVAAADGSFAIAIDSLAAGAILTAITTDSLGNSSEFSENYSIDQVTSVHDTDSPLPAYFSLAQNFPNPFNPTTTVQFSLAVAGRANLTIYNMLGEIVDVLIDRQLPAGDHSLQWNGQDRTGAVVASGIYLYRLTTGDGVSQKKMLLLK